MPTHFQSNPFSQVPAGAESQPLRLSRVQLRAVDDISIRHFGLPSLLLMENASRGLAAAVHRLIPMTQGGRVHLLIGPGNNGGDGLAAARHLHNMGHAVHLHLLSPLGPWSADAHTHLNICRNMGLPMTPLLDSASPSLAGQLVVDCLFGTGLSRPLEGEALKAAEHLNACGAFVIAADIPTGLDCDTGLPLGTAVKAARTITFAAEKLGFSSPESKAYTGAITVVDIGCPLEAIELAMQS